MAIREIFARFDFAWDRGALAQISAASQRAESKVRNVARAFDSSSRAAVGAGSSVGRLRSSLATAFATNAALRPATHFNRLGLAIGRTVNQLRAIRVQGPAAQLNRFGGLIGSVIGRLRALGVAWRSSMRGGGAGGIDAATKKLGGFKGALQDVLSSFGIFGGAIGGIFAGRALAGMITSTYQQVDATAKMAKQLGVTVEAMQSLDAAASLSGLSIEELRTGMTTMTRNLGLFAAMGKGRAKDVLKEMGLGIDAIEGRKPEQLFWDFGKAIAKIEDPVKKSAFAQRIFGESGARMLSMFRGTEEEIDALKAKTEELGVVFDSELAASIENTNDEMHLAGLQFQRIKVSLLGSIAPAILWVSSRVISLGQTFYRLTHTNRILQASFLSGGWMVFVKLLGRLFTGVGGLRGGLSKLLPMLFRIGRVLLPWLAWSLILDDIITFLEGGDSALGRFLDSMFGAGSAKAVLESLRKAWAGIYAWIQNAARAFKDWLVSLDDTSKRIVGVVAIAGVLAVAIGSVVVKVIGLAGAFQGLAGAVGTAGAGMTGGAAAAGTMSAALGGVAVAAGAAAAAVLSIWAAWQQGQALMDEIGGLEGLKEGASSLVRGEGFFAGVDAVANRRARAEAERRRGSFGQTGGTPPPGPMATPAANTPRLPYYTVPAASGTATFYDQRTIAVQVSRDATPGQTGRAVATAVSGAQKPPSVGALRGALVGAGRG